MHEDACYRAVSSKDARLDGVFYSAVRTTGIYCRPSCPARTPKRENIDFYPTAAAAQAAGFRACRRCRPDVAPGSPEWNLRADLVGRAMRLIADGVVDREGVAGLAARLGYSERHLTRELHAELGAGPLALARTQRAQTARLLLQTTDLGATEAAFAAGFSSVRQFNDTIREVYAMTPTELRAHQGRRNVVHGVIPLRLAHRQPFDAAAVFDFLALRAVPGVEEVVVREGGGGARTYRRTLALPGGSGVAEVDEPAKPQGWLDARVRLGNVRDLTAAAQRLRALFDLDADPEAVAEVLGADPHLGPLVAKRPGLRSPGHVDAHELAVRAVLGQQVTVAAARTLAGRLAARYGVPLPEAGGGLTHLFPSTASLAEADPADLAMPLARQRALRGLCAALADGTVRLDPGVDRDEASAALLALPGIGPWTVSYVRMRALADPDAYLPTDIGVRHGLRAAGSTAEPSSDGWRPWRSYAVHHLWVAAGEAAAAERALRPAKTSAKASK
ncbi:DNA-3-methyladenine glycosylase 2 family protein [Streptacidiphilus pinicola]|uniref:DNA-3-methyladenine glycosylase II n=1 Tax=Streptacidiphilus pinicola TaxID=2219663 RepID=A0A2X0J2K9_9ACTN|nr:AlkA N-terminal domain-containing protein [Streptacidiphilus pinicola]RAG84436.1 DNA-3-methyladenine glycosylase 2 family protein [Streptacidiphilus pinicola]